MILFYGRLSTVGEFFWLSLLCFLLIFIDRFWIKNGFVGSSSQFDLDGIIVFP